MPNLKPRNGTWGWVEQQANDLFAAHPDNSDAPSYALTQRQKHTGTKDVRLNPEWDEHNEEDVGDDDDIEQPESDSARAEVVRRAAAVMDQLTARQRDIATKVGNFWTVDDIANELGVAHGTVTHHLDLIRRKTQHLEPSPPVFPEYKAPDDDELYQRAIATNPGTNMNHATPGPRRLTTNDMRERDIPAPGGGPVRVCRFAGYDDAGLPVKGEHLRTDARADGRSGRLVASRSDWRYPKWPPTEQERGDNDAMDRWFASGSTCRAPDVRWGDERPDGASEPGDSHPLWRDTHLTGGSPTAGWVSLGVHEHAFTDLDAR